MSLIASLAGGPVMLAGHSSGGVLAAYAANGAARAGFTPDSRSAFALRLRDESGTLVGERVSWREPGVEDVQRLTYLHLVDGGLHFGALNGMRPRGLVVFEGRLEGAVLSGQMRFRGIRFKLADGSEPPPIHFELRKQ